MDICFYDNREIQLNEKGNVLLDRIYCLDFHAFNEVTWERLGHAYAALPHYILKENQCPTWFGEEGISSNYLYASVEPSGLQIVGELTPEQWDTWQHKFHDQLGKYTFPFFEC